MSGLWETLTFWVLSLQPTLKPQSLLPTFQSLDSSRSRPRTTHHSQSLNSLSSGWESIAALKQRQRLWIRGDARQGATPRECGKDKCLPNSKIHKQISENISLHLELKVWGHGGVVVRWCLHKAVHNNTGRCGTRWSKEQKFKLFWLWSQTV